jgi:hypothetical protein
MNIHRLSLTCCVGPVISLCLCDNRHSHALPLHSQGRRQSHPANPLIKQKHQWRALIPVQYKVSSEHQCPKPTYCINRQANMRTMNLFQIGMLAFPSLAQTSIVYIHVEYKSKYDAKLTGKLWPNGETSDISVGDQSLFDSCSNGTNFLTLNGIGTECKDLRTYAGLAPIYFDAADSDSQHLNISMPGYDLSVCTKAHVGHN